MEAKNVVDGICHSNAANSHIGVNAGGSTLRSLLGLVSGPCSAITCMLRSDSIIPLSILKSIVTSPSNVVQRSCLRRKAQGEWRIQGSPDAAVTSYSVAWLKLFAQGAPRRPSRRPSRLSGRTSHLSRAALAYSGVTVPLSPQEVGRGKGKKPRRGLNFESLVRIST